MSVFSALFCYSLFLAASLPAQTIALARVSDITIPVKGNLAFEDKTRLKAPFIGRVESVSAKERTWLKAGTPLAYLADTKTAALLDYRGMTPKDILLKRWKDVYSLIPVVCSQDCLVLRRFAVEGQRIKPGDPLFKVAYKIALVGRIPPVYLSSVHDGQNLVYWPTSNPLKKDRSVVQNYVVDKTTKPLSGIFTIAIEVRRYPQDLEWQGRITLLKNVLAVPTGALVNYQGKVFLPLEVKPGIVTADLTEIKWAQPLQERSPILALSDIELNKAFRYDPQKALEQAKKSALPSPLPQGSSPRQTLQKASQNKIEKPQGPSFWERLKNAKPLPSRQQQRKSDSEDDNGY